MSKPSWLSSQLADRARAEKALAAAADQMNTCKQIAADLRAQGREHTSDPYWRSAVRESHRLADEAAVYGYDEHAVGAEAARRAAGRQVTR